MSQWIPYDEDHLPEKGSCLLCEVDEHRFVRKYFIMMYNELTEDEFKKKSFANYFAVVPSNLTYFEFVDGGIRDFDNTSFQVYLAHKYASLGEFITYEEYIKSFIKRYKTIKFE